MKFTLNHNINDVLCSFLEQKLKIISNVTFAYSVINKKIISEILIISNCHDVWVKAYLDNKFQYVDPVEIMVLRHSSPFEWNENITTFLEINPTKIFSLSKEFNLVNGEPFLTLFDCAPLLRHLATAFIISLSNLRLSKNSVTFIFFGTPSLSTSNWTLKQPVSLAA